jgi:MgtC family
MRMGERVQRSSRLEARATLTPSTAEDARWSELRPLTIGFETRAIATRRRAERMRKAMAGAPFMPLTVTWEDAGLRIALTVLAAAAIGFDRRVEGHPLGMKTNILVALAACFAMLQANWLMNSVGKAPDSFVVLDLMRLPLGDKVKKKLQGHLDEPARLYVGLASPGKGPKLIFLRTLVSLLAAAQKEADADMAERPYGDAMAALSRTFP